MATTDIEPTTSRDALAALSAKELKALLRERGIDTTGCFEITELVDLASTTLASNRPKKPAVAATVSEHSSDRPPRAQEPSLASLTISQLKALLDSHGIDHSACVYRADLEELARGLPLSTPHLQKLPKSKSKGPAASVEALSGLDGPALFAALRGISDIASQRDTVRRVHAVKMALWRLKPTFRGMARHLSEDVHPMFRSGFDSVLKASLKRGSVVVSSFESMNRSLHGHHGTEDAHWFPVLRRAHPEVAREVDILETDHRALVALEARIVGAKDVDALQEFVDRLNDHLNREELLTIPFLMD